MREIKAYIRRDRVNQTVEKLEEAGAPGITIVDVHPVGYGYEPNYFEAHHVDVLHRYQYLGIAKKWFAPTRKWKSWSKWCWNNAAPGTKAME